MAASVSLDHHLYDHLCDTWINCRSKPQPYISLTVSVHPEDFKTLGHPTSLKHRSTSLLAMADTGCQSCLAGMKAIAALGILGAVALRFHGSNPQGQTVETRQLTYITGSTDTLFLSREACSALDIISNRFPTVGVASCAGQDQGAADDDPSAADSTCSCPRRQGLPPLPTRLPCSPTDENRGQLQEFLVNHYRASTFNTCKRQRLPLMDCSPLKLMINPDATPVACHTPIPVPLHWQESVKTGLDQDGQLGVLEPVPVGEPPHITWQETLALREGALRNRHMRGAEQWSEHTKRLPPLVVGDHVRLQNQVGLNPKKWDYTGVVVEVRQFDQYVIRVDGSGRVTLRNRRFLRKYEPYNPKHQVQSLGPDLALWRAQSSTPVYPTLTSPNTTAPSDDVAPVPPANCTACPPHGPAVLTTTGPQNSPDDHDGATPPNAAGPGVAICKKKVYSSSTDPRRPGSDIG
ncbi:hypothetical protein CAPTEDRAFT_217178 [Capitella teleta]|uniref:Uncharacterized protein n=1 Tax=Capitella teleta TaxID=283909 RepID=R7TZZ4_CAPTE|nr:hypothetical protein CAPTEDRAFT_217178 [Capitella teleta]|eukprot:ELT96981.1 hypothetical protein CAPTEDRAFT_217178 [Capitella teleta]